MAAKKTVTPPASAVTQAPTATTTTVAKAVKSADVPKWLARAMQGVTYWMGLRDSYFGSYHLTEGAIVAELCNLIAAHLPDDLKLSPEYKIEKLTGVPVKGRGRKPSFDLAIEEKRPGRPSPPLVCVEVKRLSGGDYEADIDKMADVRKDGAGTWRAFVLITSQAERPEDLVTAKGLAPRGGDFETKKGKTKYRVKRVCKALHTQKADSVSGYWACLLELT